MVDKQIRPEMIQLEMQDSYSWKEKRKHKPRHWACRACGRKVQGGRTDS